jgi:hypothetical protein
MRAQVKIRLGVASNQRSETVAIIYLTVVLHQPRWRSGLNSMVSLLGADQLLGSRRSRT